MEGIEAAAEELRILYVGLVNEAMDTLLNYKTGKPIIELLKLVLKLENKDTEKTAIVLLMMKKITAKSGKTIEKCADELHEELWGQVIEKVITNKKGPIRLYV